MEVLGRLPRALCPPIASLGAREDELASWRAGRIVTVDGRLVGVERRWLGYKATRLRVWRDRHRAARGARRCELYFHHAFGKPDFLVLGYVRSHPQASLATFYCATLVLDEIARIKRSQAIVAEVTNDRLSDRLLKRWGWERHCLSWPGRHFIKRFYGTYPALPGAWLDRVAPHARPS